MKALQVLSRNVAKFKLPQVNTRHRTRFAAAQLQKRAHAITLVESHPAHTMSKNNDNRVRKVIKSNINGNNALFKSYSLLASMAVMSCCSIATIICKTDQKIDIYASLPSNSDVFFSLS